MSFIRTYIYTIPEMDYSEVTTEQLVEYYIKIINQCDQIFQHAAIMDPSLVTGAQVLIPRIIFKSFQILINYPK